MKREVVKDLPVYMNEGSKGPHVVVPQSFVKARGYGGTINWGVYDEATSDAIGAYQDSKRAPNGDGLLTVNGNADPRTHGAMATDGFDFIGMCHAIPGTTEFVQPNGDIHVWTSPITHEERIREIIRRSSSRISRETLERLADKLEAEGLFRDDDDQDPLQGD